LNLPPVDFYLFIGGDLLRLLPSGKNLPKHFQTETAITFEHMRFFLIRVSSVRMIQRSVSSSCSVIAFIVRKTVNIISSLLQSSHFIRFTKTICCSFESKL